MEVHQVPARDLYISYNMPAESVRRRARRIFEEFRGTDARILVLSRHELSKDQLADLATEAHKHNSPVALMGEQQNLSLMMAINKLCAERNVPTYESKMSPAGEHCGLRPLPYTA